MALHPPKQEILGVTPEEQSALAALAAAQSTTVITRIGLLEYVCANDFDPKASGISGALVGARCTTVDGTKAWQKYGSLTTAWRSLNQMRGMFTVAAGGPYSTYDITEWSPGVSMAIPVDWGFQIEINMVAGGTFGWTFLRLNGATATVTKAVIQMRGGSADVTAPYLVVEEAATSSKCIARIGPYSGSSRLFRNNTTDDATTANVGSTTAAITNQVITSIGIASASGTSIVAGTTIYICASEDMRP